MSITRIAALEWWNTIKLESKYTELAEKNFPGRHFSSLTGSEIETIHKKHLQQKEDEDHIN